jgi:calcium-independent phospholipase A2
LAFRIAIAKIFSQFANSKESSKADSGQDLPGDLIRMKQEKTVEYQEMLNSEIRSKSMRLLSLDGGGIRGLCMAILLLRIERETPSKRILDYFDWIAGTSTGAIMALFLVEGYTTMDCLRFYLRMKDGVFIGRRPHDPKPLEDFLKGLLLLLELLSPQILECFGERTMNQIKNDKRVFVTTTKSDTNPPKLVMIRSYQMPDLMTLSIPPNKIKIWTAARCSR